MRKRKGRFATLSIVSIVNAIVVLLLCYFADNWSFSILTGPSIGQRIELAKVLMGISNDTVPEDFIFINTAYDKELVPVFDEYNLPIGNIEITHRGKLAEFISQLDNQHKYVMVDVLLTNNYQSDSDSILIDAILNTDRIGIACSVTTTLLDTKLQQKVGYSDYSTEIYETNFVKYEFLREDGFSLPYKAYLSEYPDGAIKNRGPFYYKDGNILFKTLTLHFPMKLWDYTKLEKEKPGEFEKHENIILNLGSDITDIERDIPSLVRDKTVVIGDFYEDDIHDTYLGRIAGPVINANALMALRDNKLEIPWWYIIFLFFLYAGITYLSLAPDIRQTYLDRLLNKIKARSLILRYLLTFIGYSFVLSIFAIIIYLSFGIDMNVLIPSAWFTLLGAIIKFRKFKNESYENN